MSEREPSLNPVEMNRYSGFSIHPAAELFPEMDDDALRALVESVRLYGIRAPLVFYERRLVDGRNRARAAYLAGIPPKDIPKRMLGRHDDPYRFAFDANCRRRDYTPGEKARLAVVVAEKSGELKRLEEEARDRRKQVSQENIRIAREKSEPLHGGGGSRRAIAGRSSPRPVNDGGSFREPHVAREMAAKAGVPPAVMRHVLAEHKNDPEKFRAEVDRIRSGKPRERRRSEGTPKSWTVPATVEGAADFFKAKLDREELEALAKALLE